MSGENVKSIVPSSLCDTDSFLFRAFRDPFGPEGKAMMEDFLKNTNDERAKKRIQLFHGKKLTNELLREIEAFEAEEVNERETKDTSNNDGKLKWTLTARLTLKNKQSNQ